MQRAMLTWLCTTACLASADSNLQSALDTLITNKYEQIFEMLHIPSFVVVVVVVVVVVS